MRTYFDTFSPFANEFSSDDFNYTFDDFIAEFNYHKPVGFTTACSVMPNVMSTTQVNLENNGRINIKQHMVIHN